MQFAIARLNENKAESLIEHAEKTAYLCSSYLADIDLGNIGSLLGYLHDAGKASPEFQEYISNCKNKSSSDIWYKKKVDHSTMGAHLIHRTTPANSLTKAMELIIMSHHSGLLDCLPVRNALYSTYEDRMAKNINYDQTYISLNQDIKDRIEKKLEIVIQEQKFETLIKELKKSNSYENRRITKFLEGLLLKTIFSALCDADRCAAAAFVNEKSLENYSAHKADWIKCSNILEDYISKFSKDSKISTIRGNISQKCFAASSMEKGAILRLCVPTGGGKTLSSLRFAINHARIHDMKKVIFVLPYTSIIEQNAKTIRDIFEKSNMGNVVLESHSNLTEDLRTDTYEQISVNWDAPIIFTTIVQFMDIIFSGSIRQNRKMHSMTNSVIIFDEVQCIPSNTIYMFNDFIRFITSAGRSTIVLCTATQPLLNRIPIDRYGQNHSIVFSEKQFGLNEKNLFGDLKRTNIKDLRKPGGWDDQQIYDFILQNKSKDILIIVNTKKNASSLYSLIESNIAENIELVYLSTNMCPMHRKDKIAYLKDKLKNEEKEKRLVCISTQLIEAGVDIDFKCVIRYIAGMDSIAQAAGRCNRNASMTDRGNVYVINHRYENLRNLNDIKMGQSITRSILDEYRQNPKKFNNDLLGEYAISKYFSLIYNELNSRNKKYFEYISTNQEDTLYDLLSINAKYAKKYFMKNKKLNNLNFLQAFQTAGKTFKCIFAETKGVIVPYKKGKELIENLSCAENEQLISEILKDSQSYSINIYPYVFENLFEHGIYKIQQELDIYYLAESLYDDDIGLSEGNSNFLNY